MHPSSLICFLVQGEEQQLLQNNCCFGTWGRGQDQKGRLALGKLPTTLSPMVLISTVGLVMAALQFLGSSSEKAWHSSGQKLYTVGAHWPMLTAALDPMFLLISLPPAVCLMSRSFQVTVLRVPLLRNLSLPCASMILDLVTQCQKRGCHSMIVGNKKLPSSLQSTQLVFPNQARAGLCRIWGHKESWHRTFRRRRFGNGCPELWTCAYQNRTFRG